MTPGGTLPGHPGLAERYRVLLEIGHTLTGTLSRRELYRTVHAEVAGVLPADGFYIALLDEDGETATVVLHAEGEDVSTEPRSYPAGESAVLRDGEAVLVRDRLPERGVLELGDPDGVAPRSGIVAPIRRRERVLGAIGTQSREADAFDENDLELLQGIADLTAVALENARQVAELKRRAREARQIESIGRSLASQLDPHKVLGQVAEAVVDLIDEADGAAVWTMHPGMVVEVAVSCGEVTIPQGRRWALEGTELERLVRAGESVLIADLASYPLVPDELRGDLSGGSGIAAPLVTGDEVAGVLSCGSRRAGALGTRHVGILERLASQASVALENARLHESVQSLSLTDPLTGLANRRHLTIHLNREVAAARRGRSLQAVIFDLDNFKGYNDREGHLAGDEVLRAFARILAEENRAMNLVARYGGDEFISVLADCTVPGSDRYVERIRTRVDADPTLSAAGITFSFGKASFEAGEMTSFEHLIQAADDRLYDAKGYRR